MKCPKCQSEMETVAVEGVQINRCTKCQGLWFDEFELDDLKTKKGTEAVDTGNVQVGKTYNKQDRIRCPKCTEPMLRVVDNDHPHIWYETCEICGGSFLDAGEFKDMKKVNLLGKIKDALVELKGGRKTQSVKLSHEALRKVLL